MFTVDTEAQAQQAIIRYCVHRYDGSFGWTDWPRDFDPNDTTPMDAVTAELREWWKAHGNR